MNTRKFYFVLSIMISIFLFLLGIMILSLANSNYSNETSVFRDILYPFKTEKEPINVLVLVGDKEESNTDVMILVNFNPVTSKISLLSIPRDTKVQVKGSSLPKINSAYAAGGEKLAVEIVRNLLKVKIKYYIYFNLSSFKKIIDLLDGVDFDVPDNLDYDDPIQNLHIHLAKGRQHLDGKKAEQLLRFRHYNNSKVTKYYNGSDLNRIDMQQKFIKEIMRQKINVYYLTKLNDIIYVVFKNIKTNIALNEAIKMCQNLSRINSEDIKTFKLSGNDSIINDIWYFIYDDQIMDVTTGEIMKSDVIIKQYFDSRAEFVNYINKYYINDSNTNRVHENNNKKKDPVKSGNKKSYTKGNPSNSESSIKPSAKDAP